MRTATEVISGIRKSAKRDIDEKVERSERIDKLLLRIPGKLYRYIENGYAGTYAHIVLNFPWIQEYEDAVLEILHEAGWELVTTHFYDTDGSFKYEFNHPDLGNSSTCWNDLTVYKSSNLKGSTCHKVKVGTKEVDVFEMECNEA